MPPLRSREAPPDGAAAWFRIIDMASGDAVFASRAGANGLPESIQRCLPSPDGRFVAVSGGTAGQAVASRHPGTAVDWSSDSLWLYVNRPGEW